MKPCLACLPWLALCLLLLGSCKERQRSQPTTNKTVLNLWHTFNPEETKTLNKLLKQVQASHPDWIVQSTVIPFGRAQNEYRRSTERCLSGAPDVFRAEMPWVDEFASKGLIRPLPPSLHGAAGALLGAAVEGSTYRDQRWLLPASLDCLALLFNRKLLATAPATVIGLISQARVLTTDSSGKNAASPGFDPRQTTRWGFYVRADAYWFLLFLWAQGGKLLDPLKGEVYIDQPASVAALQLYRDLIHKHHIAPPRPSPSNDYEDMMRRFGEGQVAMIINGPWATRTLLRSAAFKDASKLGIAPLPRGSSGKPAAPRSGHGYVVSRCARTPDQAWRLAAALSDVSAQVRFARSNSLLPALNAAYSQPSVRDNPLITGFKDALSGSRARPRHPAMARIFDDFTPAVQAAVLDDATPAEALSGVGRAWRRLLRKGSRGSKGSKGSKGR